ncbi:MAG TPA: hypothetical protein VE912_08820 [Bacteroidales bacterium]|nr:hypothetical protein [Bacteroidales bacterium]
MTKLKNKPVHLKAGLYASLVFAFLTAITLTFAMIAIPPSGPYCPANCMNYPFSELLDYYPRDYYWMYLAVFQFVAFVFFVVSIHFSAPEERKIFSFTGVAFAVIAAALLMADLFVQFTVVPVSVMKGETEGIALLTQYNGHGIFIALEELGYWMMSLSFLCFSPVFIGKDRMNRFIRLLFVIQFVLMWFFFLYYIIKYGIELEYRFEVAAITINWLTAIVAGVIIGIRYIHMLKIIRHKNQNLKL